MSTKLKQRVPISRDTHLGPPRQRWRNFLVDWSMMARLVALLIGQVFVRASALGRSFVRALANVSAVGSRVVTAMRPEQRAERFRLDSVGHCFCWKKVATALGLLNWGKLVCLLLLTGWLSVAQADFDPNDSLILYLPFDGDAKDASGNGHHGAVNGAQLTTDRFGSPDSAYQFHQDKGRDDYIEITDTSALDLTNTDFTLSAWICQTKWNYNYSGVIFSKRNKKEGWHFAIQGKGGDGQYDANTGWLKCRLSGTDGQKMYSHQKVKLCNKVGWSHVVFTYDFSAKKGTMYINGEKVREKKKPLYSPKSTGAKLLIGHDPNDDIGGKLEHPHKFFGKLDDLRIYNRTLSSSEVRTLHQSNPSNQRPKIEILSVTQGASKLDWTVNWTGSDPDGDRMTYKVILNGNPVDKCTKQNVSSQQTFSCVLPNLEYGKEYFLYVEATDGEAADENDPVRKFFRFTTPQNEAPSKPEPIEIVSENDGTSWNNGATGVDSTAPLKFRWKESQDPENEEVKYQFCYRKNAGEDSDNCYSPQTSTSKTLPAKRFDYGTTYQWWIKAEDSYTNKVESERWTFTTEAAPVKLTLEAKSGHANTLLEWNITNDAHVARYRVIRDGAEIELAKAPADSCYDGIINDPPADDFCYNQEKLASGTEYCYRIEALDNMDKIRYTSNEACVIFGVTTLEMKDSGGLKGEQVSVPIHIPNGGNLRIGASDIWLKYDSSVITFKKQVKNTPITIEYVPDFAVQDEKIDTPMKVVRISLEYQGPEVKPPPIQGEGPLVEVLFEAIGEHGSSSPLELVEFVKVKNGSTLYDHENNRILLNLATTGRFNVKKATRDGTRWTGPRFYVGEAYVRGDLNGNATIQTVDARIARFIGIGRLVATSEQSIAGDINGDGQVDSADANMIIYYALNSEWPRVEEKTRRARRDSKPILISLDDVNGVSGSEVTTTLYFNNLADLAALNLAIVYDTNVIEKVVKVERTGLAAAARMMFYEAGEGMLRINMDTQTPIKGSGAFATITLRLATGNAIRSTPLTIAGAHLYDLAGRDFVISALMRAIKARHGNATITDIPEQTVMGPYSATGTIVDQQGNPIAGVTVQVGHQTAVSNENGYWAVTGLAEGGYTVAATQDDYRFDLETCMVGDGQQNCQLSLVGTKKPTPAACQLYAVHDGKLNNSQFFCVALDDYQVNPLGPLYEGRDIEAIAIHPKTNMIYVASGNNASFGNPTGFLYQLDGQTGELIDYCGTGYHEIGDLAFSADGTLWAWAKGVGLIKIELPSCETTLVIPSDILVEGLTISKEQGRTVFYGSVNTELWRYDMDAGILGVACTNLLGETEALDMMVDNSLLTGTHDDETFSLRAFDPIACQIIANADIPTQQFDDVEGIALPVEACTK
jgi:hypothetical protein